MSSKIRITDTRSLYKGEWVDLLEKSYTVAGGHQGQWQYICRRADRKAVVAIPTITNKSLVLIKQYRVPFEGYTIEFPAGLVDEGESAEQTALRELTEETGYTGTVTSVSGETCVSAGLTTEVIYLVEIDVDPALQQPAAPDESEDIEVIVIEIDQALARLKEWSAEGLIIDAKVWSYILALFVGE